MATPKGALAYKTVARPELAAVAEVFGSCARGDTKPWSDLDLLIDCGQNKVPGRVLSQVREVLAMTKYGQPLYACFDPFLIIQGQLWCRDENARDLQLASTRIKFSTRTPFTEWFGTLSRR